MIIDGVKESSVGREGMNDSIELYTEAKVLCINIWLSNWNYGGYDYRIELMADMIDYQIERIKLFTEAKVLCIKI